MARSTTTDVFYVALEAGDDPVKAIPETVYGTEQAARNRLLAANYPQVVARPFEPLDSDRRFFVAYVEWSPVLPPKTESDEAPHFGMGTDEEWADYRDRCRKYDDPASYLDLPERTVDCNLFDDGAYVVTLDEAIAEAVAYNRKAVEERYASGFKITGQDWAVLVELGETPCLASINVRIGANGMGRASRASDSPIRLVRFTDAERAACPVELPAMA